MDTPDDLRKLALQILEGNRSADELIALVGDRETALLLYAETVWQVHGSKPLGGKCEACGVQDAKRQKTYTWKAVLSYELGKNIGKTILLLPFIAIGQFVSVYILPRIQADIKDITFSTVHNLCPSCARRIAIGQFVSQLSMLIFGIPLFCSFAIMVGLVFFSIASAFGVYGRSPSDLMYTLPALAIAIFLIIILRKGMTRIPVLLTTPANIRRIEYGGFRRFCNSKTGRLTG